MGLLLILGGILSILPGLGTWMLPLGLLLIALDVPFLRKPIDALQFGAWTSGPRFGLGFGNGGAEASADRRVLPNAYGSLLLHEVG
jgi:hypothetical protein